MTTEYNMQIAIQNLIHLDAVENYYMFGMFHETSRYGVLQFEWLCLNSLAFMHLEGIRFSTDLTGLSYEFHNYGTMDPKLRDQMIEEAQAAYEIKYDL